MRVSILCGDLLEASTDVLCTSTNPSLALMIGTGGAIRDAGGWSIQEACSRLIDAEKQRSGHRWFRPGSAHVTTAGNLPFKGIIHCVASDAFHGTSPEIIRSCVREALVAAESHGWTSVAMPLFATGHAAFPLEEAATALVSALAENSAAGVKDVVLVIHEAQRVAPVREIVARYFPPA